VATFICGEFRHQLDEKGRVRIPSRLKEYLDKDSIIMKGIGGCLYIYSGKAFEKLAEKMQNVPLTDVAAQNAISRFFASIYNLEEDGQGRTLLPVDLRNNMGLKKNIVFVGSLNKIELWDADTFDSRDKGKPQTTENLLEALKAYGI
jgi:MraZ protein